jgi:hypothetical protein
LGFLGFGLEVGRMEDGGLAFWIKLSLKIMSTDEYTFKSFE